MTCCSNIVLYPTTAVEGIAQMVLEHFFHEGVENTCVIINSLFDYDQFKSKGYRIIHYNLEHKYPIKDKCPLHNGQNWEDYYKPFIDKSDEIWDFNIENYDYYNENGYGDKFVFVPLRYTSWFEQFIIPYSPRFELQFEGVFDTEFRLKCLNQITNPCIVKDGIPQYVEGEELKFKLTNTLVSRDRFMEKQDSKFCLDIPHYNQPETINVVRIFENTCLNRQTIVYDEYNIGSREYYGNIPIYIDSLDKTFLLSLIRNTQPKLNTANVFKELSYSPESYQQLREKIKKDFERIIQREIPDSVLKKLD